MRILTAIPILLLGACQVTEDPGNNATTIAFNRDVAENGVDDLANGAEEAADAIINDTERLGAGIENRVDNMGGDADEHDGHNAAETNRN